MIDIISINEKALLNAKLRRIRQRNVALDTQLMGEVAAIIDDVRSRGDAALIEYAQRFDGELMLPADLRVSCETLLQTAARADSEVLEALREAIKRVRMFHEHECEVSWEIAGANGVRLGQRVTPLERVGLYVPGGTAGYPSSVVMNVVPAQVAGVDHIVVVTPPRSIERNPAVAAALVELNVTEVYAVGGAQAIAAMAYGTETIPQVDKITGPGNKYVAAAKKLVFGVVGIDSLAGPSEVVVIADDSASASYIAADLLAQAEHSDEASAILITTSDRLAREVARELKEQSDKLPRAPIIQRSLAEFGAIILAEDLERACALINELAPEHLEIMARDEEQISSLIKNAGAIFFGANSPEAAGDYLAGPNHVLPTGGTARFSSALSVHDFVKRTNLIRYQASELRRTALLIAVLARAEGLEAHARSALLRLEDN